MSEKKRSKKSVKGKQEKRTEPNEPLSERSFTVQALGKERVLSEARCAARTLNHWMCCRENQKWESLHTGWDKDFDAYNDGNSAYRRKYCMEHDSDFRENAILYAALVHFIDSLEHGENG